MYPTEVIRAPIREGDSKSPSMLVGRILSQKGFSPLVSWWIHPLNGSVSDFLEGLEKVVGPRYPKEVADLSKKFLAVFQ